MSLSYIHYHYLFLKEKQTLCHQIGHKYSDTVNIVNYSCKWKLFFKGIFI